MKAAQQGVSLKHLFAQAIAHELRSPRSGSTAGRVSFPLIGEDREPKVEVTNADIEAALEAEDVDRYAG